MPILILMSKINFMKYLGRNHSQNEKWTKFIETWHIWYFKYTDFSFNVKINFYGIFTTSEAQISPEIKNAQNFYKVCSFGISNMLISILMSKMIFVTYLPLVRPKLMWILKCIEFIDIWPNWYFKYVNLNFNIRK